MRRCNTVSSNGVLGGVLVAAACWAGGALAQGAYPNRPITLIVPFPAGGGGDITFRMIAEQLRPKLNQTIGHMMDLPADAVCDAATELLAETADAQNLES